MNLSLPYGQIISPGGVLIIGIIIGLAGIIIGLLISRLNKVKDHLTSVKDERDDYKEEINGMDAKMLTMRKQLRILYNKCKMLQEVGPSVPSEVDAPLAPVQGAHSEEANTDKMASFGHLTQGIVREINDPLSIIYNGVETLKITFSELVPLVNRLSHSDEKRTEDLGLEGLSNAADQHDITELTGDIRELMEGITNGATRAMDIMKRLVSFNPLVDNELKLTDIHQCIDMALHILEEEIDGRIKLSKYYDSTIPEIVVRSGQIDKVFLNVLMNAVQAIPLGKPDGEISIYTEERNKSIIIRIHDNGLGISKENMGHIFQPFFTTKSMEMGSGLGLSVSYGIIKDHSGEINLTSTEGKGTEVEIKLPITEKSETDVN